MDPPPAPPTTASATSSYMKNIAEKINANFASVFKALRSHAANFKWMSEKIKLFEARLNALETPSNVQSKKRRSTEVDNEEAVEAIIFSHSTGNIIEIRAGQNPPVTSEYDMLTVAPIKKLKNGVKFAQIGLGYAINLQENFEELSFGYKTIINAKDAGNVTFLAYATSKPSFVEVNSKAATFSYNQDSGVVAIHLESATTASPGTALSLQVQQPPLKTWSIMFGFEPTLSLA